MIQDLSILSLKLLFLIKILLQKARQNFCYSICFILTIIDLKMIIRELFGPTNLTKDKTLCIYKLLMIIMIIKNNDLVFTAFQVMFPDFK